jgi:hypothetical protein
VYEYPDKRVVVVQMIYYHWLEILLEILNLIEMMMRKMLIVVQQIENVVSLVQHQVDHHLILLTLMIDWYSRKEKLIFCFRYREYTLSVGVLELSVSNLAN